MSTALRPVRNAHPLAGLMDRLGVILLIAAVGIVLGLQYIMPNSRVIAVSMAIILSGAVWRLDMVSGLGVMALALPFPRSMIFGSTNLAVVLLMLVLWLLRVAQRQSAPPRRAPLDAPVFALFIAYVVSFYNITSSHDLAEALTRMELIAASMLAFFLITNNLHSERDFRRLLNFQAVSVLLVCLAAVYEVTHPGQTFIPGLIGFQQTHGTEFDTHNVRVGSIFYDFELFSEYCALNGLLVLFLLLRAESMSRRVAYGLLLLLVMFVLFTTVTRGAFIALGVGVLYLLWFVRRRLSFVTLVTVITVLVVGFLAMNFYVSSFTRSGDVLERLGATKVVGGWMPDSRAEAWTGAWERIFEHPLIGHGPFYSARTGTRMWLWPHCLYLFVANNVGFIGLGIFLWLLWTLFRISRPSTDDLRHGGFAQSFLIIGHVQLVVFMVDQIKIEYLRNQIYPLQVWLMFSLIVAAYQISRRTPQLAPAGVPGAFRS
jgi:O-antigen ligase